MIYQNNIQTFNMLLYNKYFLCQRFIPLLFKKKLLFIFQEDLCVSQLVITILQNLFTDYG